MGLCHPRVEARSEGEAAYRVDHGRHHRGLKGGERRDDVHPRRARRTLLHALKAAHHLRLKAAFQQLLTVILAELTTTT